MSDEKTSGVQILNGWKAIANYLGMGVRTVQRYERHSGLPIRRPCGNVAGSVLATKAELDAWIAASPIREAFQLPRPAIENAVLLSEFKRHVMELRQLRQECAVLRADLHSAVQLLRQKLNCSLPQQGQTVKSSLEREEFFAFDPMKMKVN